MRRHCFVSFLLVLVSVARLEAQFEATYRQAAQAYRDAAAQESGPAKSCMLANASYYDCVANQLSNSSLSCTQPTCSMSDGSSPASSGSVSAPSAPSSPSGTLGGPMNPIIQQNMCNYCRATGSACPPGCSAGGASVSSTPGLGSMPSGRTGNAATIQAGADLAAGLIQGIFARRAAKRAAEQAQHEAELQAQQEAAERQRQMDEWEAKQRVFEAERIETEACNTLIEAARLTGGSVDLGGDNACARAMRAEIGPLSRYVPSGGGGASAGPAPDHIVLDGYNIPRQIDFGNQGTAGQPTNALDSLTEAATTRTGAPAPAGGDALDRLTDAAAPSGAGGNTALDQLTAAAGGTQPASETGTGAGSNPLDSLLSATAPPSSRSASGNPDASSSLSKTQQQLTKAAVEGVINLNPDGKAMLKVFTTEEKLRKWYNEEFPKQSAIADRLYSGQATQEDYDKINAKLLGEVAHAGVVNPVARKAAESSLGMATDANSRTISILERTLDASQGATDADGNTVELAALEKSLSVGSYMYSVAKNLPRVGKYIEKVVTTYQQWQESRRRQ